MRTASHTPSIARLTRTWTTAGAALAAAAVLASPAAAQGRSGRGGYGSGGYGNGGYDNGGSGRTGDGSRPLYGWSGRVDREALVVMQSGDVRTQLNGYDNGAGGRARVASALPRVDGVIDVRLEEGRGRVDVIEQPSRRNGYRAVVRVRDDDAGAGFYRFVTTWRSTGGYADGGGDGYDDRRRGRDNDNDDRRRGRDRDDDGRYGGEDRRGRGNGGYRNGGSDNGGYGNGGYGNNGGAYGGAGVLHWRGRVDDVEDIRVQGGRVDVRTVSGGGASGVRSEFAGGALPASDVTVRVSDRSGRGRVSVVQQPRAWNGYTAVVRVEDRDAGAGSYDFDVSW